MFSSMENSVAFSSPAAAAAARSPQSCPTLCDPIEGSPPGSPIPGILQARTLEWVAISLSHAWKWKVKVKLLSRAWLSVTSWTGDYQAPPSMGFSRQEYWSGVPLPSAAQIFPIGKSWLTLPGETLWGNCRMFTNKSLCLKPFKCFQKLKLCLKTLCMVLPINF